MPKRRLNPKRTCRNHAAAYFTMELYILWLNLIDTNLRLLALATGNGKIVAVEFRNEDSGLRAKSARDSREQRVMVRVFLFENIQKLIASQVNPLVLRIVCGVVHQPDRRQIRDQLSIIG